MTLRRANIARIDGGLFDVLVVGAGINGAVSAAALAGRGRVGGAHRPGRLRQLHQPGVEQPGVGRLQVPRELRAAPRLRAVPLPQPADEGLPRQHQGDLLPGHPRPHARRTGRGSRHWAPRPTGASACSAPGRPRVFDAEQVEEVEPVIDTSTARGARAVPGRLPRRQRLALRLLLRALGHRGRAPPSPTTSSWSPPSGSATAGCAGCATPTPATRSRPRPGWSSTPSARSSTSSTPPGA